MIGHIDILVSAPNIDWKLRLNRNITIIQGNSGTGKTLLIRHLERYLNEMLKRGKSDIITLNISKEVGIRVLTDNLWWRLDNKNNRKDSNVEEDIIDCIVFVDEDNDLIFTQRFADFVKRGDNYFVLITRKANELSKLAFSANEVYEFSIDKAYKRTTNVLHRRWVQNYNFVKPGCILTEDANLRIDI